jgi:hypothetical protein
MAYTISPSISSATKVLFQNSQPLSTTFSGTISKSFDLQIPTASVSKVYFNRYVSGSPTTIDLTSLVDAYGNSISFTTVLHLMIVNNDATHNITVGGGTNGLFAALPVLYAGGCYNLTTTFTVDGTHKLLLITPAAGTPSVDVVFLGS